MFQHRLSSHHMNWGAPLEPDRSLVAISPIGSLEHPWEESVYVPNNLPYQVTQNGIAINENGTPFFLFWHRNQPNVGKYIPYIDGMGENGMSPRSRYYRVAMFHGRIEDSTEASFSLDHSNSWIAISKGVKLHSCTPFLNQKSLLQPPCFPTNPFQHPESRRRARSKKNTDQSSNHVCWGLNSHLFIFVPCVGGCSSTQMVRIYNIYISVKRIPVIKMG